MFNKTILVSALIAILAVGVVIPMTKNVAAPAGDLKVIITNKLASHNPDHCSDIIDFGFGPSGSVVDNEATLVNCPGPSDGSIYTRNSAYPHLLFDKAHLQNGDHITVRMSDEALNDEEHFVDAYTYTIHNLDQINQVNIRLCDSAITDPICASQRVIGETS